ncbi:MAG: polysaccharide biosynthesis tyrosine autokinase [Phycisphaerae bacterium]
MTTSPPTVHERVGLPGPPGGRGGDTAAAPTMADILAMLRRRAVLVVTLFIVLAALAVAGFVVWWRYFPLYRAQAFIECVSNLPRSGLELIPERLAEQEYERFIQTQALRIKSPAILQLALQAPAVRETDWFKAIPKDKILRELTNQLAASPVRKSNMLQVAISCRNKKDPAKIVEEVVSRWKAALQTDSTKVYGGQLDSARTDMGKLDNDIKAKQAQLRALAGRLPPGATTTGALNLTGQQVLQYGQQVAVLSLELSQIAQLRTIYQDTAGIQLTEDDRRAVEQDPQVAALAQQQFLLEQQLAADRQNFGRRHLVVRQVEAQLTAASESLDRIREEKLTQQRLNIRAAVETAYANLYFAWLEAQERLAKAEAELEDQDELLFEYRDLMFDIVQLQEAKIELAAHVKELERVVTQQSGVTVNWVQHAIEPKLRDSPNIFMLPVGILFALALAIGCGIGLEMLDTSVRTPQDIVRHLEVALLGAVPDIDDEEIDIPQVETAVRDTPRSLVAEAFRRICTNLQFSAPASQQRSIVVTSPHPEDGKTAVACNIAMAAAHGGRRVLLVDANLRRPRLRAVFPGGQASGLSNILIGDGSLSDYATPTAWGSLDVLGSGPIPPNPAELLGSDAFASLIADAVQRYDQVILDTPPVLLASDAVVASTGVDGVILVVRARRNSRGAARRACRLLGDVNTHVFGAILNAAQVTRGGYFREELRTYYDYAEGAANETPGAADSTGAPPDA